MEEEPGGPYLEGERRGEAEAGGEEQGLADGQLRVEQVVLPHVRLLFGWFDVDRE